MIKFGLIHSGDFSSERLQSEVSESD